MKKLLCFFPIFLSLLYTNSADVEYILEGTTDGIFITINQDNTSKLLGKIGNGLDFSDPNCLIINKCNGVEFNITSDDDDVLTVSWFTDDTTKIFEDCFELETGDLSWFGGPQVRNQLWPIEKLTLSSDDSYVVHKDNNLGVVERYWLNSRGAYIFVEDNVPLFIDQNNNKNDTVCFVAKVDGPYFNRTRNFLRYNIGVKENAKVAQLHAVNTFLGKPSEHPDSSMIREPIWTSWAKYKRDISDDIILQFANEIREHGFENGQLEIDDNWEICYGSQIFKNETFSDISNTIATLKNDSWRVTLWIHPFVDDNCDNNSLIGIDNGYFVKNTSGSTWTQWWNSDNSHQIDFTNPEAADWFISRIKSLQSNPGLTSFKFDAGETDYVAQPAVYPYVENQEEIPNIFTKSYINTVAQLGNLIEVRSAWRTQELPIFVRMLDKDSVWGIDNGLHSLVTTLLQLNINGYPWVLPDMIGGNGYGIEPTAELIVRWTQANTFMPAMQFSYLPWEVTSDEFDSVAIVQKYVKLHEEYADEIIKAMNETIRSGMPVNPPIWWVDPEDSVALATDDEYLLGESILVAPVLEEGARTRSIYLPKGTWKDGNADRTYTGPTLLYNYAAPIDILPYFIKV